MPFSVTVFWPVSTAMSLPLVAASSASFDLTEWFTPESVFEHATVALSATTDSTIANFLNMTSLLNRIVLPSASREHHAYHVTC